MRVFNTAGPCQPEIHYMLPVARRLPLARQLIAQRHYFILHAPRQSGKTTTVMELARQLTAEGRFASVVVSAETGAAFPADIGAAELAILGAWRADAENWLPPDTRPPAWPVAAPGEHIIAGLSAWARHSARPLVLFIDEIDSLADEVLLSALRQLRNGFRYRPAGFPWSLALIGLRDVRDYKIASGGSGRLNTASPFNIKAESLTLGNFTAAEVAALYQQHTADTGQIFTPDASRLAFTLTQGQPWLVNALARQAVEVLAPDPATTITPATIYAAKDKLIQRQDTHLDSLAERLREPRVRGVMAPLMAGTVLAQELPADDLRFVVELGLARYDETGRLTIANPLYGEVLPRILTTTTRAFFPRVAPVWQRPDGGLDAARLLEAFLVFWRQHGAALLGTVGYPEIAPHLVLMAFLDRVANGGGSVEREYAVGEDYLDLCLRYGPERVAIEVKVWRTKRANPVKEGLAQLEKYLDGLSLETGWLIIFDQRQGRKRVKQEPRSEPATTPGGRQVTVIYV